ncbi:Carbohydrate sulfotransferase 15 [Mactra antiquata]
MEATCDMCCRRMERTMRKQILGIGFFVTTFLVIYIFLHNSSWREEAAWIQDYSSLWYNNSTDAINIDKSSKLSHTDDLQHDYLFVDNDKPITRIDETLEKTQKLPFLKNFKNPCWRELSKGNNSITRCLPYFYQIGPPKCGTTDLFQRLIQHPQISDRVRKELQWISKRRFTGKGTANLSVYLQQFDSAVQQDVIPNERHGFHDMILDYKHFTRNASPRSFHEHVKRAIQEFDRRCGNTVNLRRCIDLFPNSQLRRVFIGIYSMNIEDYLRVFPRNQIFISKLENRYENMTAALQDIFSFLDIEPLDVEVMRRVVHLEKRAKDTHGVPDMYKKTKQLLEDFFKPFNDRLGELIGQEYNYNLYP